MASKDLGAIIRQGETFTVEFKGEERAPLSDHELVEAVVCLANGRGGLLLIGVEDDGRVTGARPRHGKSTDPIRLQSLIASRTRPSLLCGVTLHRVAGRPVLVIEVPESDTPVGTSAGTYLRRALLGHGEPGCLPFHFHEMQARQASRGYLDFTALPVPGATWEDLDPLEFDRLRRLIRESRGRGDENLAALPDIEIAKALGAVEANHDVCTLRQLALLLFGREDSLARFIPTHEVAFQVLEGSRVQVNDIVRWPLLRVLDELLARFRSRNREEEVMLGLLRIGVPDYSERAFREAVANAVTHRDYTRIGAVHIQWYEDRIEVSNPGGFPEGVQLANILVTPPRPRNPLLADAFKRTGIVERTGRGIDTIFIEQLRNGRPAPNYERTTDTDVVLVLPGGQANLDFVRLVIETGQASGPLGLDELLVLNQLWVERRLDAATVANLIQKPTWQARAVLERLVERGLVEARGERKARTYSLSAGTYDRLGRRAAYVRSTGFGLEQQKQMILQHVRRFGRITRRETAELCRITPVQARHLLARLVKEGLLVLQGVTRGAHYVLPRAVEEGSSRPARLAKAGSAESNTSNA